MTPENTKKLISKYPKIFQRTDSKTPFALFRFECGDGWFKLLDNLCYDIQKYLDANPDVPQVVAAQVKEKFGTLRFYIDGGDDRVYKMIADAESQTLCEECGEPGKLRNNGWIRCLCDAHAIERALTQ